MRFSGFLGTDAGLLSDLLLISLLVLVPAGLFGFRLAKRRQGAEHRLVMLFAYGVVAIFVLIYIAHNLVDGFPRFRGGPFSTFNLVYLLLGLIHSVLATAALFLGARQLYGGYSYTRDMDRWSMAVEKRAVHAAAGRRTLTVFLAASLTGVLFYAWVFVVP